MGFLVEDLLASIKLRSFVPVSQDTFTETEILAIASEEMRLGIVSDIMGIREDFFLKSKTVTVSSGKSTYTIPAGAIGTSLKTIFLRDAGGYRKKLTRLDIDRAPGFNGATGEPEFYYIMGDEVELLPTPSSAYTLEFVIFETPNELLATASCAKITGVTSVSGTTTLDVNTDLTASLVVGSKIDFLSSQSPFLLWASRVAITAISSTQIQVATADIDDALGTAEPQINDYICPTGFANIPMIPPEWHPVLAQSAAVRLLMGLGDGNKLAVATQILDRHRAAALKLIKNRVESSPERIGPRNNILRAFRGR